MHEQQRWIEFSANKLNRDGGWVSAENTQGECVRKRWNQFRDIKLKGDGWRGSGVLETTFESVYCEDTTPKRALAVLLRLKNRLPLNGWDSSIRATSLRYFRWTII